MQPQDPNQVPPPAARAQAQAPQGSTGGPSADILYKGVRKHSASIPGYVKWIVVGAIGSTLGVLLGKIDFFAQFPLWVLGFVGVPGLIGTYLRHITTKYTLSLRRVESERGIISKSVDSLELWRVLDVRYEQSLFDRMTGNATITLVGTDQSDPELKLHGLPDHRALFERLRDAVQVARQGNRPMELVGQEGFVEHIG